MARLLALTGTSPNADNGDFSRYIDELRVSNVARWTTTFTPHVLPY